jgi:trigger factor
MKSTAKEIEHRQVKLHIEAEQEEYDAAQTEAFKHLVRKTNVPGFRKGKAPRHMLEQYVGREVLVDEAIEHLLPVLYEQALETHDIHPVAMPRIELEQREPPVFNATVPLEPQVKLGDYRSVRVKPEEVAVTDEHVLAALERMRESQAVLEPAERPLAFGDFSTLDVKATVDDQPFLDHKQVTYEVVAGAQMPIPGFAESIVGLSKDESKDFMLKIPEDFRVTEIAGKDCACSVTVQQVRQKQLPELADALAETFGFDSLDALREKVGSDLESNARNQARTSLIHSALDAIEAQGEVDFPPFMEEREIDELLLGEARQYGYKSVDDFLRMSNKGLEEVREDLRPLAHKRIANGLLLNEIARQEQIEIDESEVDNRVEELLSQAEDKDKVRQYLAAPEMRDSLANRLRSNRTLDRLVEIVTADAPEVVEAPGEPSTPEGEENNG